MNHKDQIVVVFCHDDFQNLMVYCNEWYARVEVCGTSCNYFDRGTEETGLNDSTEEIVAVAFVENRSEDNLLQVPILDESHENYEIISRLISEGYNVDDDNAPAPKNIAEPLSATELLNTGVT